MLSKKALIASTAGLVLAAGFAAQADFRSSSTGSGVAKPVPPAICVGDPATNEPCVITDDSADYGDVLSIKNKAAAGTLSKSDIEGLGLSISGSVDLDDADTIAYLRSKLNAAIPSGNTPNPKSSSDILSTINGATDANVNRWVIGQAAAGESGYAITNAVLNGAGVDVSILANVDTTISNLDSNITSSGFSSSPSVTQIEDWITTTAGFHSSQSYQDVLTATNSTNDWSIADFKAASKKSYTKAAADKLLYDDAKGSSYTVHCRAEIDDSTAACTDLTKTQFNSAKTGSALLATKKTKAANGTLVLADLTELGLTTTTLGASPTDYDLDYLMSLLDTTSSATKSDWQSTITNDFTTTKASKWKLAQIAGGNSDHPTSDLDVTILESSGMSVGAVSTLGTTIATLRSNITSSSLTASSTGTQIDDWAASAAGFASGTSFSNISTAITNGWTAANYKTARGVTSTDWTNSSSDKTEFVACAGDFTPCNKTKAQWTDLKKVPTLAATDTQRVFSSSEDVSYNITSLIGNIPNGFTITNLTSGWSVSGGTISRTSTISDGTVSFRVENGNNSAKYVSGSFSVDVASKTGTYKCKWLGYSGNGGLDSSKKIGEKCRQHYGASYEAMLDGDQTDAQKRDLCDVHNQWTNWAAWGYTSPRHESHYVHRQYHGNGSSTAHWHSYEWVCNGVGAQNGCGSYSSYVLCAEYN